MDSDESWMDTWTEETSAFDRVRSAAGTLSQPQPASYIAEEALVAENTARDHLARLVDMNILLESEQEGVTVYSPDPLHIRMQSLRELLEEHDHDGLIRLKADMQKQIDAWKEEYGVETPDALREQAAGAAEATETREIAQAASDWELVLYRLSIIDDAIENYATYSTDHRASA